MEAGTPYWPEIRGVLNGGEKSGLSHTLKAHLLRHCQYRALVFRDSVNEKGKVPVLVKFTVIRDQFRKVQMRSCLEEEKIRCCFGADKRVLGKAL